MKRKKQKLIFIAVSAMLVSFLFTCRPFAPGDYNESGDDEITYTDVVYSKDGKSLTVYLDGATVPVTKRQSRALNLRLAQLGHDYFEVAFMYNNSGTYAIARAAWETGHAAGVTGVYRTDGGINYVSTGNPASGQGAAVIFVGKKSDKTLLAVGKLKYIDITEVTTTTAMIYSSTRSVTFEVAALETNIDFLPTCFLTNAGGATGSTPDFGITNMTSLLVARTPTPVFSFPPYNKSPASRTSLAYYTIKTGGGGDINSYLPQGIRIAGDIGTGPFNTLPGGSNVYKTPPRYPKGDGGHDDSTVGILHEGNTVITLMNNTSPGVPPLGTVFNPEIRFQFFTIADDDGKINSFYFEIPVVPLATGGNPGKWYIRPGYDSYLLDLDNGFGGTGGAILFGIGDLGYLNPRLDVNPQPEKVNYNSDPYDYYFDIDGIKVNLRSGNYRIRSIDPSDTDLTFWVGYEEEADWLPENKIIPGFSDLSVLPAIGGSGPRNAFDEYGHGTNMIIITVRYPYGDLPWVTGEFAVYRSEGLSVDSPDDIAPGNRFVIRGPLDLIFFYGSLGGGNNNQPYILIAYNSFNLQQIHLNASGFTFIILAGAPDLVFGKADNAGGFHHYPGSYNSTYYLGVWPFNGPVAVDGESITTYPFVINAVGRYQDVNAAHTAAIAPFLTGGWIGLQGGAGSLPQNSNANYQIGGGVRVLNNTSNLIQNR